MAQIKTFKGANNPEPQEPFEDLTGCPLCDVIVAFSSKDVLEKSTSFDVGSAKEALSHPCPNHQDLVYQCLHDYERLYGSVSISRERLDSGFQVGPYHYLGMTFELAREPETTDNEAENRLDRSAHSTSLHSSRRYGRILDNDWIDFNTAASWYQTCKESHHQCRHDLNSEMGISFVGRPKYLVDVNAYCIVEQPRVFGKPRPEYTALSYVWGKIENYRLTKDKLPMLQERDSLRHATIAERIPRTVRHAIDMTRLLGIPYLWVDTLCIIQDGEEKEKVEELNKMADIFHGSCFTLVVADGPDADYGIRGLGEVTQPLRRNHGQQIFSLGKLGRAIVRKFSLWGRETTHMSPKGYYERAWTLQEYMFSKKRLIFEGGSVLWECCESTCFEDVHRPCGPLKGLPATELSPDVDMLAKLINGYNARQVTYETDRLRAFAGVGTAMSLQFRGGFICGLPKAFIDMALLWQPDISHLWGYDSEIRRRGHCEGADELPSRQSSVLPSWSWAGWIGSIDFSSWKGISEVLHESASGLETYRQTIPITTWYLGDTTSSSRRILSNEWYSLRENAYNNNWQPLDGWRKHSRPIVGAFGDELTSCYFTHYATGEDKFRYPTLLNQGPMTPMSLAPLLFASVDAATFYTCGAGVPWHNDDRSENIETRTGDWVGILVPHSRNDLEKDTRPRTQPLELVAISLGSIDDYEVGIHEYNYVMEHQLTNGKLYEFYNVLWVKRYGEISERRGIGRVPRKTWESYERRRVDLILG